MISRLSSRENPELRSPHLLQWVVKSIPSVLMESPHLFLETMYSKISPDVKIINVPNYKMLRNWNSTRNHLCPHTRSSFTQNKIQLESKGNLENVIFYTWYTESAAVLIIKNSWKTKSKRRTIERKISKEQKWGTIHTGES